MERLKDFLKTPWGWIAVLAFLMAIFLLLSSSGTSTAPVTPIGGDSRVSDLFASPSPSAAVNQINNPANSTAGAFFEFAWKFVLLIIIILLVWRFTVRFLPKNLLPGGSGNGDAMTVIERINISPSTQLLLLEVDGARLLIGATPSSVNLVVDLSGTSEEAAVPSSGSTPPEATRQKSFADQMTPEVKN